jgi:hypothetical protein
MDEIAYFRNEELSKNPDAEIWDAAKHTLASTGGPILAISSPYAMQGVLWDAYKRDYGPDGDPLILVGKAPSKMMNPGLSQKIIDRAYEKDPLKAAAEFGAEFRSDVSGYIDLATVEVAVSRGVTVRPPIPGVTAQAFCDPSGGKSDSMTLAVGWREGDKLVLACAIEVRAPFAPESICDQFSAVMKSYRVQKVYGDRWGGEWPAERFRKSGITYEIADKSKSDIYLSLLPLLTSGRCDLLDNPRLVSQLAGLERRTARGGRDSVDHSRSSMDDLANSVAGLMVNLAEDKSMGEIRFNPEVLARLERNQLNRRHLNGPPSIIRGLKVPV